MRKKDLLRDYENDKINEDQLIRAFGKMRADEKKMRGVVYTPRPIVEEMIRLCELRSDHKIWEPSCGHGGFLFPLLDYARNEFSMDWAEVQDWFIENASANDVSAQTVTDVKEMLAAFFRKRGVNPKPYGNVWAADSLLHEPSRYDVCLGNPPYIRTQKMDSDYLTGLRTSFASMRKGNVDIYYAFIERCVEASEKTVLIVPNACLDAVGAKSLRDMTFPHLKTVIDFKAGLPFDDARAYVAILSFDKSSSASPKILYEIGGEERDFCWAKRSQEEIGKAPRIAKSGIATLCDSAYAVRRAQDGKFYAKHTGMEVEGRLVRELIKATKPEQKGLILFPYSGYSANGLIPEDELKRDYPKAYAHLTVMKDKLLARDKGKTEDYPSWYAFGRTQGLHDLRGKAVVFVPAMIGGASRPFLRRIPADAGVLFVSGFAVIHEDSAKLLSEDFLDYVREHGKEKPGEGGFHNISSKHVNAFLEKEEKNEKDVVRP